MAFGLRQEGLDELMAAIQGARSPVDAALEGEKHATDISLAKRKQAFAEKLAAADQEAGGVKTKQDDAALKLRAIEAARESTIVNPITGAVIKRPGSGWDYDPTTHAMIPQRIQAAGEAPPKVAPQPKETPGASAGETKAAISNLEGLLAANANSYGGLVGGGVYGAKRLAGLGGGDEKFENTTKVNQGLRAEVLRLLRSSKLGQISEGERQFMMELAGSEPSEDPTVRRLSIERLLRNAKTLDALERGENTQSAPLRATPPASSEQKPISANLPADKARRLAELRAKAAGR